MSQITLQASSDEVEAAQAMATLEYPFRGSVHVKGGIGALAQAMVRAIEAAGGEIRYFDELRSLERRDGRWHLRGKRSRLESPLVFANVLPQALVAMAPKTEFEGLDWRIDALEESWGACMHYLLLRAPEDAAAKPRHLQLVADPKRPLREGNNVFLSIAGAGEGGAPPGMRTATMSTHLAIARLREKSDDDQAQLVSEVQERMLATLRALGRNGRGSSRICRLRRAPSGVSPEGRREWSGGFRGGRVGGLTGDFHLVDRRRGSGSSATRSSRGRARSRPRSEGSRPSSTPCSGRLKRVLLRVRPRTRPRNRLGAFSASTSFRRIDLMTTSSTLGLDCAPTLTLLILSTMLHALRDHLAEDGVLAGQVSHSVSTTLMKNCEPLVFGPAVRHREVAALGHVAGSGRSRGCSCDRESSRTVGNRHLLQHRRSPPGGGTGAAGCQ